jgi:PadR family transcriptional regulator PadR
MAIEPPTAVTAGRKLKGHFSLELLFLQGTLDLMVLQTLAMRGPMHGYAIAARIEQVSSGAIQLNMGTLYPGLLRLEQRGFVRAQWDRTETNRRARYYSITAAGRRQLETEKAE